MGKWKLLLPYKDGTIISYAVSNALDVCSRVILVTGFRSDELEKLFFENKRITTVQNNDFERGMFSSIQTGTPLVETEWFFITMGDMPGINSEIYRKLLYYLEKEPDIEIIRPLYNGKRGHPVLLKKNVTKTIAAEPSESEMKNVFTHHRVLDLNLNIPETFTDIDTEEDYRIAVNNT